MPIRSTTSKRPTKDGCKISSHFGIYPLEQSIALRGDKFLKKYSSSDNTMSTELLMSTDSQTLVYVLDFSSFSFSFCCCVVFVNVLVAYFYATIKLVK